MSHQDRNSGERRPEVLRNSNPLQTDHKPKLFLERPPGSAPYSQEEFDEIVPEFMHRDFYRSQEDAVEAVEPSGRLKAVRSRRRPQPPKPEKAPRQMEPLRAPAPNPGSSQSAPVEEREPLEPLRDKARETDTVVIPREESKSDINFPLVLCLLLIVGLFLWREQTRPNIESQQELPIPREVPISQEVENPSALGADSPYPEMSPGAFPKPVPEEPVATAVEEVEEPAEIPEEAEVEQPVTMPRETETAEAQDYPATEASAQRAAILERVSEGTVSRGSRESRMERDVSPAEPADSSLFPDMDGGSEPAQIPPPVDARPAAQPRVTVEGPDDDSLFPGDTQSAESPVEVVQPPPVKRPAAIPPSRPPASRPGEPYQIAEPKL